MANNFKEGLKEIIKELEGFLYTYGHYLNNEQYLKFSNFKKNISIEFGVT